MSDLEALLYRAGHRPSKRSKSWICADCPRGKLPAMRVSDEVFYCHRCQKGGNIVTLKRELGIEMPRKTALDIRLEQEIRLAAELKLARIRIWQKQWRWYLIHRFRKAYDQELEARDRGKALLDAGLEVDPETIAKAVSAADEKQYMTHWINWFDGLSGQQLITEYEEFQRVINEPLGRLESERAPERATTGERSRAPGDSAGSQAVGLTDHSASLPGQGSGADALC